MIDQTYCDRYMRDSVPIRLGNLSSSLGRLADTIDTTAHTQIAQSMLEECKWFIEWTAAETEPEVAEQLVKIQVKLAGWQRGLVGETRVPLDTAVAAREARECADKVLEWSGLLD